MKEKTCPVCGQKGGEFGGESTGPKGRIFEHVRDYGAFVYIWRVCEIDTKKEEKKK